MVDVDPRQAEHYPGFEGKVGKVFATSEPAWPERPTPPPNAPNIVIVLADDLGFSDVSCYGSEIATPAIDALADAGIRYSNFHVTPLCSPTRAALLTGLNSHAAGMGFVANADPGFPGYASELPHNQPSLAEVLKGNGYATMAVGKWHLCREQDLSVAGDNHSWPLQRGFDQFYGILEALTNFHHPHLLYEGNSPVDVDEYPEGYYFTDDESAPVIAMTDEERQYELDLNLNHTFWTTRQALRHMVPRGSGRVIALSSIEGKHGKPNVSGYTANKHAINGFVKSAAREVGRNGVTVNAICPGLVITDMVYEKAGKALGADGLIEHYTADTALGRCVTVDEVAAMALHLASDAGAGITGATISVDGGAAFY